MDADELIDRDRYVRSVGDASAVHVGLLSRVEREGFPAGYDLAIASQILDRISDIAAIYGLRVVGTFRHGAGEYVQPAVFSKLEANFIAEGLQWLPKVTADAAVLDAAERLATVAEACKRSPSRAERLLVRYVT